MIDFINVSTEVNYILSGKGGGDQQADEDRIMQIVHQLVDDKTANLKDKLHRRNMQIKDLKATLNLEVGTDDIISDLQAKLKAIHYQLKDEESTPLNLTTREKNILRILNA